MNTYLKITTSLMHSGWKKGGPSKLKGKVAKVVGQAADNTMRTV